MKKMFFKKIRKMSQQYLLFSTSCGDHSDAVGLTRFNSAKEAIFYFIAECARMEVDNDNPCMAVLLEKLTVKNENEIEQKINERIEYLNEGFDIEDEEERFQYWEKAKCFCETITEDCGNIPHKSKENIIHTGTAYEYWSKRDALISTLEKKDLHVNMGEPNGLFPCGLFQHYYFTSGNRKNHPEINISMCHSGCDRGLEHVETISE
jgi:hypothetical protein